MREQIVTLKGRQYRVQKPLGDGGVRLTSIDIDDESTVDIDAETFRRLAGDAEPE